MNINSNQYETTSIIQALKNGECCLLFTDLGFEVVCDGTNSKAVNNALSILGDQKENNYSLIVSHIDQLGKYIREFPEIAEELINVAVSPLILLLPKASGIEQSLISSTGSAPFRIISEGAMHQVAQKFNRPLLAIPALGSYDKLCKSPASIPVDLASKKMTTSNWKTEQVQSPSIIELSINGEIKIIRN